MPEHELHHIAYAPVPTAGLHRVHQGAAAPAVRLTEVSDVAADDYQVHGYRVRQ